MMALKVIVQILVIINGLDGFSETSRFLRVSEGADTKAIAQE